MRFLPEKEAIINRLQKARKSKRFSQEVLAQKIDVRSETITRWESKGTGLPNTLLVFKKLCEETGASADWILGLKLGLKENETEA